MTVVISVGGTPVAGQSFTLTCQATTALSNPTYQWFSDNGTLISSSAVLTINELQESNTGEYSCQVTAGNGADQRYGCGVERIVVQGNFLFTDLGGGIHIIFQAVLYKPFTVIIVIWFMCHLCSFTACYEFHIQLLL